MEDNAAALERLAVDEGAGHAGAEAQAGELPSLAELAAQRAYDDWTALPHSLLGDIFRRLLELHTSVEDIVRAWQTLALVCPAWLAALRQATPLCLELTKPSHLSPAARAWLCSVPMEVVVLARTMSPPPGADCQLLASEAFQAHSASLLRSLMHVGPGALPLLHTFSRLKQVALFCGDDGDRARRIDVAAFHQLPKLSCLTVAGHWGHLDTSELPARLKHLALSNYNEGYSLEVVLPAGMKQLELLSVKADGVVLNWVDACQRCEEIHVAGEMVLLGVGQEAVPRLVREVGLNNLQAHLYKRVGSAMTAEGARFMEATIAFFNLALFSGPHERGVVPIDADEFLQTLRDDMLPVGVDVNPGLEVHPEFVRDLPSPDACFVLELVKQEQGKPKSMHFTTPVSDAEIRLLASQPVWRISWCEDPRAAQVLADPQFLANSAGTLTDLLSIPLVTELELRPYTKLLSVLGLLRTADVAPILRRMPPSLESLCLTAEGSPQPRDFDAAVVRHLRQLKELSLYGHRRHHLAGLRPSVNMIRILNPLVAQGEVIGTGANYSWPDFSGGGDGDDSSGSSSGSEWGEEEYAGGSDASQDSFSSATSEISGGGSGGTGKGTAEQEATAAGAEAAAAAAAIPASPAAVAGAAGSAAGAAGAAAADAATGAAGAAAGAAWGDGPGAAGLAAAGEAAAGEAAGAGQAAAGAAAPARPAEAPADAAQQAQPPAGAQGAAAAVAAAAGDEDDQDDSSSSSSSSSGGDYLDVAEHGHGHSHSHGHGQGQGGYEDERHSKKACQDPYCPLHSGKSFLQISLTDERPQSVIDFSALLAAGFQMLTITLTAEQQQSRCTLLHDGQWRAALAALENSDIEVLELNCQSASMVFRSKSLLHRRTEVSVHDAMRYVAQHYSDTWQVKSWNGNTAADGVLEGSRGYALMRRSVLLEQEQ